MSEFRKVLINITKDEKDHLSDISHECKTNMTIFARAFINAYRELSDDSKSSINDHVRKLEESKENARTS